MLFFFIITIFRFPIFFFKFIHWSKSKTYKVFGQIAVKRTFNCFTSISNSFIKRYVLVLNSRLDGELFRGNHEQILHASENVNYSLLFFNSSFIQRKRQGKHKEYCELLVNTNIYSNSKVYLCHTTMHRFSKAIVFALLIGNEYMVWNSNTMCCVAPLDRQTFVGFFLFFFFLFFSFFFGNIISCKMPLIK